MSKVVSIVLLITVIGVMFISGEEPTKAQAASGPVAYYSPNWDPVRIYNLHHSWGNTVANPTRPGYNTNNCVHPNYRPGQVLSITVNGVTTTCVIFDMVAMHDQPQWRSRWALEVDWNTFHRLGLNQNNWVTVHGLASGGSSGAHSNPSPSPSPTPAPEPEPRQDYRYFSETGHLVGNAFLHYWEDHGGLSIFGYPLSDEFDHDGMTIQVFERAVLEFHPEHNRENRVLLRRLGAHQYGGDVSITDLSNKFASYYSQNGGLRNFGHPISPVIARDGMLIQYTERSRFELHEDGSVMLGRVGAEVWGY